MKYCHIIVFAFFISVSPALKAEIQQLTLPVYIHIDPPADSDMTHDHSRTAYWYQEAELLEDGALTPADCIKDQTNGRYVGICNNTASENVSDIAGVAIPEGTGFVDLSWLCLPFGINCANNADVWVTSVDFSLVERNLDSQGNFVSLKDSDNGDLTYQEINLYAQMNHHSIMFAWWPDPCKDVHQSTSECPNGEHPYYGAPPFKPIAGDGPSIIAGIGSELTGYSLPEEHGINLKGSVLTLADDGWHWVNPGGFDDDQKDVFIKVVFEISIEDNDWAEQQPPADPENQANQDFATTDEYDQLVPGEPLVNVDFAAPLFFGKDQIIESGISVNSYTFTGRQFSEDVEVLLGVPHVHNHATAYDFKLIDETTENVVFSIAQEFVVDQMDVNTGTNTNTSFVDPDFYAGHELGNLVVKTIHQIEMCMDGEHGHGGMTPEQCLEAVDTAEPWHKHDEPGVIGHLPVGGLPVWTPTPQDTATLTANTPYTIEATVSWDNPHKTNDLEPDVFIDNMYAWIFYVAEPATAP